MIRGTALFTGRVTRTDELRALDELADRLQGRFPQAPPDRIKQVVSEVHHQYDASRVRDFIPVLVEREVVEYYRASAERPHAG